MNILGIIIGLLAGIVIGYLFAHSKNAAAETRAAMLTQQIAKLEADINKQKEELQANYQRQLQDQRQQQAEQQQTMREQQTEQLQTLRQQQAEQLQSLRQQQSEQLQSLKQQQAEQLQTMRQQQADQLQQQSSLLKEQINTASEEILKRRAADLNSVNQKQMSALLNPLHENLKLMKEAVEKSDHDQTVLMSRLDASIQENLKQAHEVGQRADKLAEALTGENKTQGNFGELRLRTLLEQMGLEEGVQFEEQVTLKDEQGRTVHEEDGHKMIPDVILHFPDKRDVIIDAKMSLKAFEDYHNATTDAERDEALQRHLTSVRSHVKELARKKYDKYAANGKVQLDFVVMYVYSESALQLALTHDPALWKDAYDQGVIISGSQNLYMMLRVLEMTWRQVRQAENQDAMLKAADEIINRVQLFYERFQTADQLLDRTRKAFDDVKTTTAPTGMGIATAANKLLKYGAQENPKRKVRLPKDNTESLEDKED